jgi:hypothetical protein
MPSSAGTGSGQDTAITINDLAQRFVIMEDLLRPLQPLVDTVSKLASQVAEQGQQQQALNQALLRLEHDTLDAGASAPCNKQPGQHVGQPQFRWRRLRRSATTTPSPCT